MKKGMKITMASDIHMSYDMLKKIGKTKGDLLLIAGDLTNTGHLNHVQAMLDMIDNMNYKHKIVVYGNHDIQAELNIDFLKGEYPGIHLLNNEIVEVDGMKIYGTPYATAYNDWGFAYRSIEERKELTLPKEPVDIIVAHEPPSHIEISYTFDGLDIGNPDLRRYIEDTDRVKLVVCGHVHEFGGTSVKTNNAIICNVARSVIKTVVK